MKIFFLGKKKNEGKRNSLFIISIFLLLCHHKSKSNNNLFQSFSILFFSPLNPTIPQTMEWGCGRRQPQSASASGDNCRKEMRCLWVACKPLQMPSKSLTDWLADSVGLGCCAARSFRWVRKVLESNLNITCLGLPFHSIHFFAHRDSWVSVYCCGGVK